MKKNTILCNLIKKKSLLIFLLILIFIFILVKVNYKALLYDAKINQVITKENQYLYNNNIITKSNNIIREKVGIVVYSKGKFIELIYDVNQIHFDSYYIFNGKENDYELFNDISNPYYQKYFNTTSYTENIGIK